MKRRLFTTVTTPTLRLGLAMLLGLVLPSVGSAASLNWGSLGAGGVGTWNVNTTANWFDGGTDVVWPAAPGSGDDDAVFGGTSGAVTIAPGGVIANDLTFNADGYLIQGDTLTLDAALTKPILLTAPNTTNTINAVIAGTNGFNKYDTGTLILTGSNTFYGNVQLGVPDLGGPASGVLRITQAAALGVRGNVVQSDGTTNQFVIIRADGTRLELDGSGGDITIPDHIVFITSGPNGVIRNLAGNNVINSEILATTGVSDTTIKSDGGALELAGPIHCGSSSRIVRLEGTNSALNIVSGVISNGFGSGLTRLWKRFGVNTWMLTSSNSYSDGTFIGNDYNSAPYVSDGYLRLAHNNALGTGGLTIRGGYQAGGVELTGNITVNNTMALTARQGPTYPHIRNVSGTNTLTGNIAISANGSRLNFESADGLLTISGNAMTGSSGRALALRGAGAGVFAKNITAPVVSSVDKFDGGTWTLGGSNTFTGGLTVGGGTLVVGSSTALGFGGVQTTATGGTTVSSGYTLDLNGNTNINEPITVSGTGVGGNGALINSSVAPCSIGSGIAGAAVPGTGSGSGYSTPPAVVISGTGSGATANASLGVTAASFTINGGTTTYSVAPTVTISGGGGSGATATATLSSGVVSGITITAAGTGFTSAPTIAFSAGTVLVAGTNPTGTGNAVNFTVGGLMITSAGSGYTGTPTFTFNGSAAAATATLSSVSLATNAALGGSGDMTIDAVVNGAYPLTKVGAGKLTLTGNNSYGGSTTISNGTLRVTGSISNSAVTVAGGTLSGTGYLGGAVAVTGGTLEPGVSTNLSEMLTINNDLTLAGTALVQIGKSGATPVNDSVTGIANITYGGTLIVTNATGAAFVAGDAFVLFSASGTVTGNFTNIVVAPAEAGLIASFNPVNGTLSFSSAVVPQPTLNYTNTGGSLDFSWTGSFKLQSQTNTLSSGLGTNWFDYPGGGTSPVSVPVSSAQPSVFFRLSQ